jgi:anaerobic ribonucleoside-triphosphate reductase activating protein
MDYSETQIAPNDESYNPADVLNIAAVCPATRSLGPGLRAALWVQGCVFSCPGCVAPEWVPLKPARLVRPEAVIDEILSNPDVTGLTFSGGEPMLQAAGLAKLARLARARRELNIICFTGYQRSFLVDTPPGPGVRDLLDQLDVLIDGPYVQRLNDNRGLRGSRNQRVHHLTSRLAEFDLETQPRRVEVHVQQGQAMLIGVPPVMLEEGFNRAVDRANQLGWGLLRYERA